jgi:hypothetical protein
VTAQLDSALLLLGLLFSSIGFGFLLYGKRQRMIVPLVCGLALMIFPYFVPNAMAMIAIGIALSALPYFFRW